MNGCHSLCHTVKGYIFVALKYYFYFREALVETLNPRLLRFEPPRALLPLYGFAHWLLDYFTAAAADAVPPIDATGAADRPWASAAAATADGARCPSHVCTTWSSSAATWHERAVRRSSAFRARTAGSARVARVAGVA